MLLLFTTPHCSKCTMVKFQLDQNGIKYQEVFAPDNPDKVEQYSVISGGTLVDEDTSTIITVEEAIEMYKGH